MYGYYKFLSFNKNIQPVQRLYINFPLKTFFIHCGRVLIPTDDDDDVTLYHNLRARTYKTRTDMIL